jgi:hypothetical protein
VDRQRGNIALYLLFSLAVSTGAGYGVYVLLRERAHAAPGADESEQVRRPKPAPAPVVEAEPVVEPMAAAPPVAIDSAERDAVAPEDIPDPDKDTVLLGRPGVAGALDADKVERTVKRYQVRYERCMRRAHEKYRLRRGELRLTFVIAADGNVDLVTSSSSVEGELATCVVDVVKKLKFDKSTDGSKVKVVYPMRFVPAKETDPWSD